MLYVKLIYLRVNHCNLKEFVHSSLGLAILFVLIGFCIGLWTHDSVKYLLNDKEYNTSRWERTWRMYITKNRRMAEIVLRSERDSLVGSYLIFDQFNNRYITTKMKGIIENENLFSGSYFQYDDNKLIVTGKFIFGLNEDGDKFTGSYMAYDVVKKVQYKKSDYWVGELIKK